MGQRRLIYFPEILKLGWSNPKFEPGSITPDIHLKTTYSKDNSNSKKLIKFACVWAGTILQCGKGTCLIKFSGTSYSSLYTSRNDPGHRIRGKS